MKGLITSCWSWGPLWHPSFPKQGGHQAGWLLIFNDKSMNPRTWVHWVKYGIIFMLSQISFSCPGLSQGHCVSKHLMLKRISKRKMVFSDLYVEGFEDAMPWPLLLTWAEQSFFLFFPACLCPPLGLGTCIPPWGWAHTHFPYSPQHKRIHACEQTTKKKIKSAAEWS